MTELLVGTKKGLFVLRGEPGDEFEVAARSFAGEPVEYAIRDPRSGRYLASVTSAFYGPKVWVTDDPAGEWQETEGLTLPEGQEQALKGVEIVVPRRKTFYGADEIGVREPGGNAVIFGQHTAG